MSRWTNIARGSVCGIYLRGLAKAEIASLTLFGRIKSGHRCQIAIETRRAGNSLGGPLRAVETGTTILLVCICASTCRAVRPSGTLDKVSNTICIVLACALANIASRAYDAVCQGLTVLVCGVIACRAARFQILSTFAVVIISADHFRRGSIGNAKCVWALETSGARITLILPDFVLVETIGARLFHSRRAIRASGAVFSVWHGIDFVGVAVPAFVANFVRRRPIVLTIVANGAILAVGASLSVRRRSVFARRARIRRFSSTLQRSDSV